MRELCRCASSVLSLVAALSLAVPVWAKQDIVVSDDQSITVDVSVAQLTLIKMPSVVVPNGVMTSNGQLQVKAKGRNVMISAATTPSDLVIITDEQSYTLRLNPKPIPAETVVITDARLASDGADADPIKQSDGYVDGTVELFQQIVQGTFPRSYARREIPKEAYPRWLELDVMWAEEIRGPVYTAQRYRLHNKGMATQALRETEFYTGEQLAIALDRHVIQSGEEAVVYVLSYTKPLQVDKPAPVSPDPEPWRN